MRKTIMTCDICGAEAESMPAVVRLSKGRGPSRAIADLCGDCSKGDLVVSKAPTTKRLRGVKQEPVEAVA